MMGLRRNGISDSSIQLPRSLLAIAYAAMAIGVVTLLGCAAPAAVTDRDQKQLVWPAWPDQPRLAYEATLQTEANIVAESSDERLQRMLSGGARANRPIIDKPSGLAVRGGRVYVAEPSVKAVAVLDAARGKLFRFGLRPPNTLERPQGIALDANSNVYVLDSGLHKVMVFDELGLFKYSISLKIGFTYPVAIAVSADGNTIFVVDRGDLDNDDHKVVAFAPDGKEKFRIGPRGREDGKFNIPLSVTLSKNGTLLVADSGNARIQAFDQNGKFKFSFGGFGSELGRFARPRSIATDSKDNIYVSDAGFNNVQVFNAEGVLLMYLGRLSQDPAPGNYSLIGAVAIDEEDRLFVTDNFFKKIEVFRHLSEEEGKQILAKTNAEKR